ncbi:MAG: hypothetical protein CL607_10835 [Anaerolineaceae bacterium]|nr:hypothetical protein [Anaerolineaceae bacterium]
MRARAMLTYIQLRLVIARLPPSKWAKSAYEYRNLLLLTVNWSTYALIFRRIARLFVVRMYAAHTSESQMDEE